MHQPYTDLSIIPGEGMCGAIVCDLRRGIRALMVAGTGGGSMVPRLRSFCP